MSKMIRDRKPPLAKSPIRLRPRRSNSSTTSIQTPPGKSKKPLNPTWEEACPLRPEYRSISCELQALAKMVHQELGNPSRLGGGGTAPPLPPSGGFERGRFYEEYSARRKERLNSKRKSSSSCNNKLSHKINGDACFKTPASKIPGLGVTATNNKKKNCVPAAAYDYYYSSLKEGLTLTTCCNTTNNTTSKPNAAAAAAAPRYMLRSMSKENRKPPAPNLFNSVVASGVRRTRPF